ncbi:MAG: ArsR/SmtB family transcription factor [Acidimicrobiia bacterium]
MAADPLSRVFAALADPTRRDIVARLSTDDATVGELADRAGVSRLVAWERINDLVQVGLVARALEGDRAGLTGAGRLLVELVEEVAEAAAAELDR